MSQKSSQEQLLQLQFKKAQGWEPLQMFGGDKNLSLGSVLDFIMIGVLCYFE